MTNRKKVVDVDAAAVVDVTDRKKVVDVDVAAVVAELLAQHAPGTPVAGPESGGVQVIRVALDLDGFRELLETIAATLDHDSHLRLDVLGGLVLLDVTRSRLSAEQVDPLRTLTRAMDGRLVPDPPAAAGYSVQLPSGLSEWG